MEIWDEKITASGGRCRPTSTPPRGITGDVLVLQPERHRRLDAIHYAQLIGVRDLVSAARLIEAFIRKSDAHAEAMGIAARNSGVEDQLPDVFAAAEAIRAYLAEPASGEDLSPPSAEP